MSEVDNQVPGVYPVTFFLSLDGGEAVYKQVKVTVHPNLYFDKNSTQYGDTGEKDLGMVEATYTLTAGTARLTAAVWSST
ncbi:hypothetical protein [Actinomyces faecalis]|uniref:hypothetical protein n=1 Tax=Actinomyces faecalis TaxID=2722820 RepID=UPI0015568B9F|nr:hypothetical protein [Actinomyces faecalis]